MKVALLTREFPPHTYGGAGVHVEHLSRELDDLVDLSVHCFAELDGTDYGSAHVQAHKSWGELGGSSPYLSALRTMSVNLVMTANVAPLDLVHSHTWYTNFAGYLISLAHGVHHVATVHSLEPLRPWKREQLAGGYDISSFCERTGLEGASAIIAVSSAVASDVVACYPNIEASRVHVIPNGVDTDLFRHAPNDAVLGQHGIDPDKPIVLFVGRISRQKGIDHVFRAVDQLDPAVQLVVRAGAADTAEIGHEVSELVRAMRASGRTVSWIEQDLPREDLVALISGATLVCAPSVYEPFGLVNIEAMACEVPVVASAVGGIPEVVKDGVSGLLVKLDSNVERFATDLAEAMDSLLADPARAKDMGSAGRASALEQFSWRSVAVRTVDLYRAVLEQTAKQAS